MASKLDRSLDEILAERPRGGRRGGKRGGAVAPAGGIRKPSQRGAAQKANVSIAQTSAKGRTTAAPSKVNATKIVVSNLPTDVTEDMIKQYFTQVVGPLRRVFINYGPNGASRGVATVEFVKPGDASTAAQKYNGVVVDKKPMKVELIVDPNAPPSFADRVGPPNKIDPPRPVKGAQPKPVAGKGAVRGGGRGARARGGRAGGRAGSGRGKPKTAEELDQEMSDYMSAPGANPAPAAATNAASGGDAMEDEVL